jgi:ribonuclease P protein component
MGCKLHTPHFILLIAKHTDIPSRLGLTVSRKVGNAVQRNRVKRMVREYYRTNALLRDRQLDISVIAKRGAAELSTAQVANELATALKRNGLTNG